MLVKYINTVCLSVSAKNHIGINSFGLVVHKLVNIGFHPIITVAMGDVFASAELYPMPTNSGLAAVRRHSHNLRSFFSLSESWPIFFDNCI